MPTHNRFDDYDNKDYIAYTWGYGEPPPLHYSAVELVPVETTGDLLCGDESYVLHQDLLRPRVIVPPAYGSRNNRTSPYGSATGAFYQYQSTLVSSQVHTDDFQRYVVTPTHGKLINPPNGAVVYHNDPFVVALTSYHQPADVESWTYFTSGNLDVWLVRNDSRPNVSVNRETFAQQQYRVSLKTGERNGFLQLFQAAKYGVRTSKGSISYGTLRTLFVSRSTERHVKGRHYPPLVPVFPNARQTFVPLLPMQMLQVITPGMFNIDNTNNNAFYDVKPLGKYITSTDKICAYFKCNYLPRQMFPIFVSSKSTERQGVVIVPPIDHRNEGVYAILHNPMEGMEIFTTNIDGFIFRTSQDVFTKREFLDTQFKVRIESKRSYQHPETYHPVHDLTMRIMDKSRKKLRITNLHSPNACKAS